MWSSVICWIYIVSTVHGAGLLLLYRPKDVSNECAFSKHLRYDLSFGMGMSDTITLVFRTLSEIDYQCEVEITTESTHYHLLVVIRYPNAVVNNCAVNQNAFTVFKKNKCLRLCEFFVGNPITPYFIITLRGQIRFRFVSNSSINIDMNAHLYQVTATAARTMPAEGCSRRNETICTIDNEDYCFTSGVVCDGIKNCGIDDWFDEQKSQCGLPVERISYAPVIAVIAVIFCALLVAGHALFRFLPPAAASFFIFNANEDNRLCIDSVFISPDPGPYDMDNIKKNSIIPVCSDSSASNIENKETLDVIVQSSEHANAKLTTEPGEKISREKTELVSKRKGTMKTMNAKIQQKLLSVKGPKQLATLQ